MTQAPLELRGIEIENLRSFERANLQVDRPITLLVGPNNSGKTSILRILDWVFRTDQRELEENPVAPETVELLEPARTTRAKARRLTLFIRVLDGRRHQRFKCEDSIARLRVGLRVSPEPSIRVNLGRPTRSEGGRRDSDAYVLFEELRQTVHFRLIPATRDAASPSFEESLDAAITRRLEPGAINVGRGRGPAGSRTVAEALKNVKSVAEDLVEPLWEEMKGGLPAGMVKSGTIRVDAQPADLVTWIASVLRLRISTGAHDAKSVRPTEVGSGLQSLLELALAQTEADLPGTTTITALEEPEAFLHPSAQRTLARDLFQAETGKRIVSTHSPILVEEASYGDVVLVHDRQFHHPSDTDSEGRMAIHSAFLTRYGAEMVFAQGVLLVEGESDREFFEGLRRRIAAFDSSGRIDGLIAIPTGSKDRFGPWIRLIRSYRKGSGTPLNWLTLVDGDGPTSISTGFKEANVRIEPGVKAALRTLAEANSTNDLDAQFKAAEAVNTASRKHGVRIAVAPGDLEWSIVGSVSDETAEKLGGCLEMECGSGAELARVLGSKHVKQRMKGKKEPWRRAVIARELPMTEVSSAVRQVMKRWLAQVMPWKDAEIVLVTAEASG